MTPAWNPTKTAQGVMEGKRTSGGACGRSPAAERRARLRADAGGPPARHRGPVHPVRPVCTDWAWVEHVVQARKRLRAVDARSERLRGREREREGKGVTEPRWWILRSTGNAGAAAENNVSSMRRAMQRGSKNAWWTLAALNPSQGRERETERESAREELGKKAEARHARTRRGDTARGAAPGLPG